MTKIKISFCGVDDTVKINDLEEISKENSFIEWSILLHPGKEGTLRYPSRNYINLFKKSNINKSCHLCGNHVYNIFNGKYDIVDDLRVDDLGVGGFNRIQINATIENGVDITKFKTEYIVENLLKFIKKYYNICIVLQYNDQTKDYCDIIMKEELKNVYILLDTSCGLGIYTGKFPKIKYERKGFAGGLNINNIGETVNILSSMGENDYWLDMESGIRKDNKFDLNKVKKILDAQKNFFA